MNDQFTWFTLQLLTTSGRGRCNYKPLLFHLERLRSHYAYVEVSMLYGFNAFNRTVVYLLPSNKYRGRELHVIVLYTLILRWCERICLDLSFL